MKINALIPKAGMKRSVLTLAVASVLSQQAMAVTFELDNGVSGSWNTTLSAGTSMRMQDPDRNSIATSNGGLNNNLGSSAQDDGNLNFKKGDIYSSVAKAITEVDLRKGDFRVFARAKAWYDYSLDKRGVEHGHVPNGYVPGARLDDSGFEDSNKFSGITLLDFYAQGLFVVGDQEIDAKIGRSVANWGESLFFLGVNSYSVLDVAALRRPGAELKEALLPTNQLQLAFPLDNGGTIEAFYQFSWERTTVDGCGTYFSGADLGLDQSCNALTLNLAPDAATLAGGLRLARGEDVEASDDGQFGLGYKFYSETVDTEFGLYYVNYNSHVPIISAVAPGGAFSGDPNVVVGNLVTNASYFMEYVDDVQIFGLSGSTDLSGWSVAGEVSYHKDLPVQLNTPDALGLLAFGAGPLADRYGVVAPTTGPAKGTIIQGYDLLDKTQLQFNFLKAWSQVLGASNFVAVGEAVFVHAGGMDDAVRYGRAPLYGSATHAANVPASCTTTGDNADAWCEQEGFVTENSWGYKLRGELSYTNLIAGTAVKPSLFFGHDVEGYSPTGMLVEDRKTLGLGLKFDINKTHFVNLTYNKYFDDAEFDVLKDRDFASISIGTSF